MLTAIVLILLAVLFGPWLLQELRKGLQETTEVAIEASLGLAKCALIAGAIILFWNFVLIPGVVQFQPILFLLAQVIIACALRPLGKFTLDRAPLYWFVAAYLLAIYGVCFTWAWIGNSRFWEQAPTMFTLLLTFVAFVIAPWREKRRANLNVIPPASSVA